MNYKLCIEWFFQGNSGRQLSKVFVGSVVVFRGSPLLFSIGILLGVCFLSGCSWHSVKTTFHPTVEDKRLAGHQGQSYWKMEHSIASFGFARSLQLLETKGFTMTKDGGLFLGGTGTAAVISSDGYALTAKHVIDGGRKFGVIANLGGHQRIHLITFVGGHGRERPTEERIYFLPFPDPRRLTFDERRQVSLNEIRIVHQFSGQDLALIKLPKSHAPFFEIGETPLRGEWVFASGNGISAAPFSTAGKIVKVADQSGRFLARMPSALGDSGGPIFNGEGKLVGIFSKLTPEGAVRWKGLRWFQNSCCEIPDKSRIEKLISADRSRSR